MSDDEQRRTLEKRDPEKTRERRRRWEEKNRDRLRECRKAYHAANRERILEKGLARYAAKRLAKGLTYTPKEKQEPIPCKFCGHPRHYAKGLCRGCWARCRTHGSPEYRRPPGESAEDRFRRSYQVDVAGCWVWGGATDTKGYPVFQRGRASRFSYELAHGRRPARTEFKATCGNRRCVNPAHLVFRTVASEAEKQAVLAAVGTPTSQPERREAAARMRAAGLMLDEIGRALGVSREGARQLLLPHTPRRNKRAAMEAEWEQIAPLLAEGKTRPEIAAAVGLMEATVANRIRWKGYRRPVVVTHRNAAVTYEPARVAEAAAEWEAIRELMAAGKSWADIAARLGLPVTTVRRRILDRGYRIICHDRTV